jgi:hypothetical protein
MNAEKGNRPIRRLGTVAVWLAPLLVLILARPNPSPASTTGRPWRIAIVFDASAQSKPVFERMTEQVGRAVESLRPTQSFLVVACRNGTADAFDAGWVTKAKPPRMRAFAEWLWSVIAEGPSGGNDFVPAVDLALAARPDLIYLITGGDIPDHEGVRTLLDEGADRQPYKLRCNVVLILPDEAPDGQPNDWPGDAPWTKSLASIADAHHGRLKVIRPERPEGL